MGGGEGEGQGSSICMKRGVVPTLVLPTMDNHMVCAASKDMGWFFVNPTSKIGKFPKGRSVTLNASQREVTCTYSTNALKFFYFR